MIQKAFRTKIYPQIAYSASDTTSGFFKIFFMGVSAVLGAGIYFCPFDAVKQSHEASIISLVAAGMLCTILGLSYAELSSRISGYTYEYIYATTGEFLALFQNLAMMTTICFSCAIQSKLWIAFANQIVPIPYNYEYFSFIPNVLVAALVLSGRKTSSVVNNVATIINITSATVIAVLLMTRPGFSFSFSSLMNGFSNIDKIKPSFSLWFYSLFGYELIGNLSRVVKDAEKYIPFTIVGAILVTIGLGFSLAIGVMGQASLDKYNSIFDIFEKGSPLFILISFGGVFGTSSTLLCNNLVQGEIIQALSQDGLIPQMLNKRLENGVPHIAIITHMIFAILMALTKSAGDIAGSLVWSTIGVPISTVGLLYIIYEDKSNPKQLTNLKTVGFITSLIFLLLGLVDTLQTFEFTKDLAFVQFINTWHFRGTVALIGYLGFAIYCSTLKSKCPESSIPGFGFPFLPIFGAMLYFFCIGYTMSLPSCLTILTISLLLYIFYSSGNSKLNSLDKKQEKTQ